jgi:catechol 2,3-dioxygenase-like lactoylglutathione lyase family enzyme
MERRETYHTTMKIVKHRVSDLDQALGFYSEVLGIALGHRSGEYA